MLTNPFDQPLAPMPKDLGMFDEVDQIIGKSVAAGDPLIALDYGKDLIGSAMMRGLALAKLFYKLRENWGLFEAAGVDDTLKNMAYIHTGRSPETVEKYIRMWEAVFENEDIPDDIKKRLMGRQIGDLLLITALAREGADRKTFEQIANAADSNEIRAIIKTERGERTSAKNAVYITLERRENGQTPAGTLIAVNGSKRIPFGSLDLDIDEKVVQQAITRLIQAAGIKEIL
jgi:hypothetical protein